MNNVSVTSSGLVSNPDPPFPARSAAGCIASPARVLHAGDACNTSSAAGDAIHPALREREGSGFETTSSLVPRPHLLLGVGSGNETRLLADMTCTTHAQT